VAETLTIKDHVEKIASHHADTEVRVARRLEIGTRLHQGDVYLHVVADDHPRGKKLGTRQVAVGTTIGSRHIVVGDDVEVYEGKKLPPCFKVPEWCSERQMLGPVVVGTLNLTHPEHAHHKAPCGTFQVTYQADYSTRQRVSD
jgi:hypothetical protein